MVICQIQFRFSSIWLYQIRVVFESGKLFSYYVAGGGVVVIVKLGVSVVLTAIQKLQLRALPPAERCHCCVTPTNKGTIPSIA